MPNIEHNSITGTDLHLTKVSVGTGAPVSAPPWIGAVYFDTAGPLVYYAKGTSSVSDWVSITSNSVIDNIFFILNAADNTRRFRFDAGSISASTSRVLTVQDANYIIAGRNIAQTFSGIQTFANDMVIQSTAEIIIQGGRAVCFNNSANTFSVRHKSKASLASNVQYSWPEAPTETNSFLSSDLFGNLSWAKPDRTSVVANDADTVFTASDNKQQLGCLPTAARTYTLPSTGIFAGDVFKFYNNAIIDGRIITVKASAGANIDFVIPTQVLTLVAKINTPTLPAHWQVVEAESAWFSIELSNPAGFTFGTQTLIARRQRSTLTFRGLFGVASSGGLTAFFQLPVSYTIGETTTPQLSGSFTISGDFGTLQAAGTGFNFRFTDGTLLTGNDLGSIVSVSSNPILVSGWN